MPKPELTAEQQYEELTRGAVDVQVPSELKERLEESVKASRPLVVKAGFDPTAPDLHLGHTVLLMRMRRFQRLGHRVVFLIGDFTGMIGDPTGKSATRKALTPEEVQRNAETYKRQVFKILDPERTEIRFNNEWFAKMGAQDLIRLAARYPVARMLERDDFKTRFREGRSIAIHEFLYPLCQAYDSVMLRCDVELGGSDQLFNLLVGREIMKDHGLRPQLVITSPLLEGIDAKLVDGKIVGEKMSKSLGNYVGIDEPPEQIFGKLMSITDDLMWRYHELLSAKSGPELAVLKQAVAEGKLHPKQAKVDFAKEMVTRFHSAEAAERVAEEFERVHQRRELPDQIEEKTYSLGGQAAVPLARLLAELGLASSNSEARRLISQGGVTINGERSTDTQATLGAGDYLFKVGKRRFLKARVG